MINKFSPDLFVQRLSRSDYQRGRHHARRRNKRLMVVGGLLVLLIALGYGIFSYLEEDIVLPNEIPHIEATLPIKERPDNPGGIDIPHQDMEVFAQLENRTPEKAESAVEHLLPPTASGDSMANAKSAELGEIVVVKEDTDALPLTATESEETGLQTIKTQPSTEEKTELPPAITEAVVEDEPEIQAPALQKLPEVIGETENPKKEVKAENPVEPSKTKDVTKAQTQEEKAEEAVARLPEELFTGKPIKEAKVEKVEKKEPPQAAAPTIKKETKKTVKKTGVMTRVQIASFPQEEVASREISRYRKRFESVLGKVQLEIVRADITGRGTYFRIMTALIDKAEADRLCEAIKRKNGSCLVKK
ncbi:MAG: SPOR domain-containing protein [Bdellovibrionales bacterium]